MKARSTPPNGCVPCASCGCPIWWGTRAVAHSFSYCRTPSTSFLPNVPDDVAWVLRVSTRSWMSTIVWVVYNRWVVVAAEQFPWRWMSSIPAWNRNKLPSCVLSSLSLRRIGGRWRLFGHCCWWCDRLSTSCFAGLANQRTCICFPPSIFHSLCQSCSVKAPTNWMRYAELDE